MNQAHSTISDLFLRGTQGAVGVDIASIVIVDSGNSALEVKA